MVIAGAVLIAGIVIYAYLGGFNSPEISIIEVEPFKVYGYPFKGKLNEPLFGESFRKSDSLVDNKHVTGKVTGVFYNQPEQQDDTVSTFVGVLCDYTNVQGLEQRSFNPGKVVQATIKAKYMVMPINIYPKITEFAEKNDVKLSEKSFEIYESEDFLKVWIPVE